MSGPSAHERVKKLEARGVIRGYAAIVDPAADRLRHPRLQLDHPGAGHRRDAT